MYDTLMYTKKLEASGLTREQAEAQVHIMAEMIVDGVATKHDLNEVRQELKGDINGFRQELKNDIGELRHELKVEINDVRQELKIVQQDLKNDIQLLHHKIGLFQLSIEHRLTVRMGLMFMASTTLTITVIQLLK